MNGAAGRRVYGFSSTERTVKSAPSSRGGERARVAPRRAAGRRPFSCPSGPKSRPCATRLPSSCTSRAANGPGSKLALDVPVRGGRRTPSARARARRRAASPPTARGRPTAGASPSSRARARPRSRRAGRGSGASPASRRGARRSPGCARARPRSPRFVISWKTMRAHGHLRLQLLERCQAIASPSRSSSVASSSSSASFSLLLQLGDHLLLVRVDDVVRLELVVERHPARRSASVPPSGRRRRASAGHGCGRCSTRRRSRDRGSRRSSSPSPATRR